MLFCVLIILYLRTGKIKLATVSQYNFMAMPKAYKILTVRL